MERQVNMEDISDGRLYGINDMVKADCHGCRDCSVCCQGMGSSILLDPLDIFRLSCGLNKSFEEMIDEKIELNVVDGLILPNLKMADDTERCVFLTEEGRCGIHAARPGICRIFPLGRLYENRSFRYFLQIQIPLQIGFDISNYLSDNVSLRVHAATSWNACHNTLPAAKGCR